MRYAARIDTTQPAIVDAYRAVGALVLHIGDPFDLLVWFQGRLYMVDPKTQRADRQVAPTKTAIQQKLIAVGWPIHFPRTPEEALAIIGVTR